MSRIVGIDLGTTNSLVATVDSGIPLVIADAEGRRLTPSVVHFPGNSIEKEATSPRPSGSPSPPQVSFPKEDERFALRGPPKAERGTAGALSDYGSSNTLSSAAGVAAAGTTALRSEPVVGVKANRVRVVRPE